MKKNYGKRYTKEELARAGKALQQMTLLDDFLFGQVVKEKELMELLTGILMEGKPELLGQPETEKLLGISPALRKVRLDVFSMDTEKNIYAVEMQKENTGNLPRRSRLYQAQIDVSLLPVGTRDMNEINDVFLIMICPFDLFGKGACRYTFYEVCKEYPELRLEDGGSRMFINTRGKNREKFSREFVELLDYINAPAEEAGKYTVTEPVRRLHEGILRLKKKERTMVRYMQRWEQKQKDREEGREEGERTGRMQGAATTVKNMMSELGVTLEKACQLAEITPENYHEYVGTVK